MAQRRKRTGKARAACCDEMLSQMSQCYDCSGNISAQGLNTYSIDVDGDGIVDTDHVFANCGCAGVSSSNCDCLAVEAGQVPWSDGSGGFYCNCHPTMTFMGDLFECCMGEWAKIRITGQST